jgi:acyl dehydratase
MTENIPQFKIGHKYISQGRTLSEADFVQLHNLCWITSETHTNAEFAKHTRFGSRILPGPCVLAVALGLDNGGDFRLALRGEGKQLQALLEYEYVKFFTPVRPGDTVHLETEVLEANEISAGDRQIMRIKDNLINQNGDTVLESVRKSIIGKMERRVASSSSAAPSAEK